jgi:LPLT family lysophospholipid transporter-like MFS transporter
VLARGPVMQSSVPQPALPRIAEASLCSPPALAVIAAQALGTFADTALLLVAIIAARGGAESGLLQQVYVLPFLILAPLVAAAAGGCRKRRLMLVALLIKLAATAALILGFYAPAVIFCVGTGAALYSPAKYGMLMEMFGARRLVAANAAVEGSSVLMAVAGTVISGFLVDHGGSLPLALVFAAYLASAVLTLALPEAAAERLVQWRQVPQLLASFVHSLGTLFAQREARCSLLGTSLMLGGATTLRLLVLGWSATALALSGSATATSLMGVAAAGMIVGAVAAGMMAAHRTNTVLLSGVVCGILIALLGSVHDLELAVPLIFAVGVCAGSVIVPLNAALQRAGAAGVGAGCALAVQNFCENLATIAMVGGYAVVDRMGAPASAMLHGFGIAFTLAIVGLLWPTVRTRTSPAA